MTKTQESHAEVASATDTFALVHPGLIVPDPNNVRDELTDDDPTDTDPNEEAPADDPIHDVA